MRLYKFCTEIFCVYGESCEQHFYQISANQNVISVIIFIYCLYFRFYDYIAFHDDALKLKDVMNSILKACIKWKLTSCVINKLMKAYTFSFQVKWCLKLYSNISSLCFVCVLVYIPVFKTSND